MKLRTALLAATVLALPVAVKAQTSPATGPINGPYVSLGAGINLMPKEHIESASARGGDVFGGHITMRDGFVGQGSIGYGLGNGLRIELEGDYLNNSYQSSTYPGVHVHGEEQKYGAMVNALYDIPIPNVPVEPYVGLGAGYQWVKTKNTNVTGLLGGGSVADFGQTQGRLAAQAIAGVAFNIPAIPGLALTAEYRFMAVAGTRGYDGTVTGPGALPPAGANLRLNHDWNNSILVGLRYALFAAPAAAPAPAPAPTAVPAAVTRNYLVFFDWDRADLTDRARQIISEAAQNSKRVQVTRIQVNGYTDTSGTAAYNQRLSVRRAQSVAAELVRDGVPRNEISIQGFGETHLLVPTAKGVREPQNRRVEIILQ